jgi:hypothetical protein
MRGSIAQNFRVSGMIPLSKIWLLVACAIAWDALKA